VAALFDTGALELLRRRHRRVEDLALKLFPPVICSHIAGEFLFPLFKSRVDEATLVAARIYLAPFEMLVPSMRTTDLCAQVRASQQGLGKPVTESVCWIAAHALEHDLPIVTTDRQFRAIEGLRVHLVVPALAADDQEKRRPALAGRL
jgi:predicted nucleic acid-binding protein